MADPFKRSSVDGTENSVIPLMVVDQLFLKSLPTVIALRLESPCPASTIFADLSSISFAD